MTDTTRNSRERSGGVKERAGSSGAARWLSAGCSLQRLTVGRSEAPCSCSAELCTVCRLNEGSCSVTPAVEKSDASPGELRRTDLCPTTPSMAASGDTWPAAQRQPLCAAQSGWAACGCFRVVDDWHVSAVSRPPVDHSRWLQTTGTDSASTVHPHTRVQGTAQPDTACTTSTQHFSQRAGGQ